MAWSSRSRPTAGASTEPTDKLSAAVADRYAIERELGAGGMATVYLARDLRHDRAVALKVLRPELGQALGPERFLREIKTTAQLAHPHILPLLDSGDADGTLYYVMPFVEGESLRDRLTREKQLSLDEALRITREVADALGYAHSLGLVHRDIKPENILFEAGHAVVADFGIAKAIAAAGSARLTETGLAIGTPVYMSPEQASGEADLDGRSDLYSLGCVLYEMLAGEPPFTGPSVQAVVAKRLSSSAPRISILRETVPPHVERALNRALARLPADRFVTAVQFAEALGKAEAQGHRRTDARRVPTASLLVAALLIASAGIGLLIKTGFLWPSGAPRGGKVTSLVVLPLRNLSGDSTQDYFADGVTEELITELGQVAALTVISSHTAMTYKKKADMPLPEIARELHVQAVVEGSVVREGGHVRITARLIDGRTDRRLWDSTYDMQTASVLALYAQVARTIAGAIGATLTPEETGRLRARPTVNPQAYDEYLLGRHQAAMWTAGGFTRAIAHYRRAIALDSTFADPQASLVDAYWMQASIGAMSATRAAPLAKVAAERAAALDPGSARAHAALAQVRSAFEWRFKEADGEYRRALELNPGLSDVHFLYSGLLTALGRHDEAVQHALRAVVLDPLQANLRTQLGWVYFYAGRYQESIAAERKALELEPTFWAAEMELGWNYSALGRHQEAIEASGRALKADPENQVALSSAAFVNARAGRPEVGRSFRDSLLALSRKGVWVDPYNVGWACAFLGETDRALESFSRAIEERSPSVWGLKVEWLPESFKADPRYHTLLRRIGLE